MGNEVKVILSSRTLLVLEEDAKKGDFINLNNLISKRFINFRLSSG